MKKKGMVRIVIGFVLIAIQILGMYGNFISTGSLVPVPEGANTGYLAGYYFGYFLFSIVGAVLLFFGFKARKNSIEQNNSDLNQNNSGYNQ